MQEMKDKIAIEHIGNKQHNKSSPSLSVIALNVNGLKFSNQNWRKRLTEWRKPHEPTTCCLQETHKIQRHKQLKRKEWKKTFHAKSKQKRLGEAMLVSGKVQFKSSKL